MNDEHREETSGNGRSSQSDSNSTATAELIDRRWFEDALRAQGFLVEAPAELTDSPAELPWAPAGLTGSPADVTSPALITEDTPQSEPAAFEWLGPEPEPESAPPATLAEPARHAIDPQQASVAATPETPAEPWHGTDQSLSADVAAPVASWPVIGDTPTRVVATHAIPASPAPVATGRQPVAPTTLAGQLPPVPTAALAARLSRGRAAAPSTDVPAIHPGVADGGTNVAPLDVAPEIAAALEISTTPEITAAAETVAVPDPLAAAPVTALEPMQAPDPWSLPTVGADLDTTPTTDVADPRFDEGHTAGIAAAVATSAIGSPAPEVVDASSAEVTARVEADLQTQIDRGVVVEATDVIDTDVVAPASTETTEADPIVPAAVAIGAAAEVTPERSTAFEPPTTGIAAVAPRPPGATVGTTVDDGESDLWGLVGDPRKAAAPVGAAVTETRASRMTTIVLTVIVAFVVVALVLGFLYLLTDLL